MSLQDVGVLVLDGHYGRLHVLGILSVVITSMPTAKTCYSFSEVSWLSRLVHCMFLLQKPHCRFAAMDQA